MREILFLHGFYQIDPETTPLLKAIRSHLPVSVIHAPAYHPKEGVTFTRIGAVLEDFRALISRTNVERINLIGFSFGGLLAALFAERYPDLVEKVLLFAPAIDNFERNYADRPVESWGMPSAFVNELSSYPARPTITRPTSIVHGSLDTDQGGSALWRIEQWISEQPLGKIFLINGVDHSLEPWLSQQSGDTHSCREGASLEPSVTLRELLTGF